MNIQSYATQLFGGVEAINNTSSIETASIPEPQSTAKTKATETPRTQQTFENEQEILVHISNNYDLVVEKMVFFGGSVLKTVAADPSRVEALERVLDTVNGDYEGDKNHAEASGGDLTHYSVEISETTSNNNFALQVETWSKRNYNKPQSAYFKNFSSEISTDQASQNHSIETQKSQAKSNFRANSDGFTANKMKYQVQVVEVDTPSSTK